MRNFPMFRKKYENFRRDARNTKFPTWRKKYENFLKWRKKYEISDMTQEIRNFRSDARNTKFSGMTQEIWKFYASFPTPRRKIFLTVDFLKNTENFKATLDNSTSNHKWSIKNNLWYNSETPPFLFIDSFAYNHFVKKNSIKVKFTFKKENLYM